MRLGLGPIPLAEVTRDELGALARAAFAASFDAVWVAEDRAHGVGGGLAAAAMVGQIVPIRVGAVVDAGGYHPLHLAEDIAVADIATGGRVEVLLRSAAPIEIFNEHVDVLALALRGSHLSWDGDELTIPARLEANEPVPSRLAVNPQPLQPAVPIWLMGAARPPFGLANRWRPGINLQSHYLPDLLLCSSDVDVEQAVRSAADRPGYFVVDARTPGVVAEAGRRLAGPLRMPAFPVWINQQ